MTLGESSWYADDEEENIPYIPSPPVKKPGSAAPGPADESPDSIGYPAFASLWPWLLGFAALGGGAYWLIKRNKRSKKGR